MIPERQQETTASQIVSMILLVVVICTVMPLGFVYALVQCRWFLWFCFGASAMFAATSLYRSWS